MKKNEYLLAIAGLALAVAGFIFIDFGPVIRFLIALAGQDARRFETINAWLELFVRVSVALVIVVTVLIFYVRYKDGARVVGARQIAIKSRDIVQYLRELPTPPKQVTLFGYSLSFAEELRLHFIANPNQSTEVRIVVPAPEFIERACIEDKPKEYRIAILKGRIHEWTLLVERQQVGRVSIWHHSTVPNEWGVIINDEVLFIGRYPWKCEGETFLLSKNAVEERVMQTLYSPDKMYILLTQVVRSKENQEVTHEY